MIQPEIWLGIKTNNANDEHEEQHLEGLTRTDKAPEEVFTQLKCSQNNHNQHWHQNQVIIIIDFEYGWKFITQRKPDFVEHGDAVVPIVVHGNKEKNSQKAH